jgi:hypothetical protein
VAGDTGLLSAADPRAALSAAAAARGITTASGRPIVFVNEDDAPAGTAYEAHIAATGRVPTRPVAHDLFNALVWLAFPRVKARLNALQAAVLAREGVAARRGPLRDAATVFDENGALLATKDEVLVQRLRARQWRCLFVEERPRWDAARVLVIGHALLDRLRTPYKAITAHALVVAAPASTGPAELDARLAAALDEHLTCAALLPLPVLGIPGWWRANRDPSFYDDGAVFRSARGASAGRPRG